MSRAPRSSAPSARPARPAPRANAACAATPAAAESRTLTPADWIEAATALLVDQGIDAVRVDVLARQLGVTRGSFYWHFKDRDDLLRSALQAWRDAATEQIIQRFDDRHADPRALLRELVSLPFRGERARRAASVELAIRDWARRDAMARQAVDEVDERRISYQAQVFSALGFSIAEARIRAFALYAHEVAESLLFNQGTEAQKVERAAFVEQLMLTPLAPPPARRATPPAPATGAGGPRR